MDEKPCWVERLTSEEEQERIVDEEPFGLRVKLRSVKKVNITAGFNWNCVMARMQR
ncbi:hypothetical protein [Evansella clarkii]|uniref:hypothetical protein n=1 Tax=Evansella clarkii TaxID=79879 RepID=UPI001472D02D|nr:hypothetical protein [Evansella clarkii]